jgi:hypothetical protein
MDRPNETGIIPESRKRINWVLMASMRMRDVVGVSGNDEKKKGRQPQIFTGTSAIFRLTTEPRVVWVKGT